MKLTRLSWLLLAAFVVGCQDEPAPSQKTPIASEKDTAEPKFDLSEPPVPSDGSNKSAEKPADKSAAETVGGNSESADTTPASTSPK